MKKNGKRSYRKIPAVLSTDEQSKLLAAIDLDSPAGMRNFLIIRLALDAGLRSAEALSLRRQDINLTTGELRVTGKGNKQRLLWLGVDLVEFLKAFIGEDKPKGALVFVSRTGKVLTTGYLRSLVRRLVVKAGIEGKHVHPHTLRHSFATDLLRQSKNLMIVSKALGHANLATTQIYLHICDPEMEEAMKGLRTNGEGVW